MCQNTSSLLPDHRKGLTSLKDHPGSVVDWLWVLAWGVASSIWCLTAAHELGATFDEPFYIAGGLEFWQTGSHGTLLRKGTMPLPVDVGTLPAYLWELWQGTQLDPADNLYRLLPWARLGTLAFWWLLLIYTWRTGHHLAGPWGGRLAVALLAFEPNLLAHASLATTDIAVTACLLALCFHFCTGREAGWIRRVGIPAFWFAATVLSKASGLFFGPLCLLVVELERLVRSGAFESVSISRHVRIWLRLFLDRLQPFRRDFAWITIIGMVLVFLYCGSDWRQELSFVAWAHSLPDGPVGWSMVWLAEHLRIFTNAGYGLVRQFTHNVRGHGVYLLGQTHPRALWYYFPVLLTIKLSVPLLFGPLVLAAARSRALLNWAILAAVVLLAFSPIFRVQIGIRLILPLVVLIVVGLAAAGVQGWRESDSGWRKHLIGTWAVTSVIWMALTSVLVWPNGLSYVNQLWGGPSRGYVYVSDSNYDWGQGLKELAAWQRQQGLKPTAVWYYGTDPILQKLPLKVMPLHALPIRKPDDVIKIVKGYYLAVSTTLLYGLTFSEPHREAKAFLLTRQPVARTTTFLIYDFSKKDDNAFTNLDGVVR